MREGSVKVEGGIMQLRSKERNSMETINSPSIQLRATYRVHVLDEDVAYERGHNIRVLIIKGLVRRGDGNPGRKENAKK